MISKLKVLRSMWHTAPMQINSAIKAMLLALLALREELYFQLNQTE